MFIYFCLNITLIIIIATSFLYIVAVALSFVLFCFLLEVSFFYHCLLHLCLFFIIILTSFYCFLLPIIIAFIICYYVRLICYHHCMYHVLFGLYLISVYSLLSSPFLFLRLCSPPPSLTKFYYYDYLFVLPFALSLSGNIQRVKKEELEMLHKLHASNCKKIEREEKKIYIAGNYAHAPCRCVETFNTHSCTCNIKLNPHEKYTKTVIQRGT